MKGARRPFLKVLERTLVDAVCDAGVDINMCLDHAHVAPMLAFVGGLGLRKADMLRQNAARVLQFVPSRQKLLEMKLLGKVTYVNAAGFIRVDDPKDPSTNPLDRTRLHPELYEQRDLVLRIVSSAMNRDMQREFMWQMVRDVMTHCRKKIKARCRGEGEGAFSSSEWIEIMARGKGHPVFPNRLFKPSEGTSELLDTGEPLDCLFECELDAYADTLIASGDAKSSIRQEMTMIKNELRFPWMDWRDSFKEPPIAELNLLLSGETATQLHPGRKVSARIERIPNDFKALLRLEDGLRASLHVSEVSDQEITHIADVISEGQAVTAVILKFNAQYNQVEVSLKDSLVKHPEQWWIENRHENPQMREWMEQTLRLRFDRSFKEDQALNQLAKLTDERKEVERLTEVKAANEARRAAQGRTTLIRRPIYHPVFKNIGYKEAETELLDMGLDGVGECIIRPGRKGVDTLSISWLFTEHLVRHIDVREEGKPGGEEMALGTKLYIRGEDEPFSDLDDILANYIAPMNDLVSQMFDFKYFKLGNISEIESEMKATKRASPKKVPYWIRLDPQQPGYFVLTWMVQENRPTGVEYISVRPHGYKFRDRIHKSPRSIIAIFQEWLMQKLKSGGKDAHTAPVPAAGTNLVTATAAAGRVRRSRFTDASGDGGNRRPARSRFSAVE